jgi:L-lactate utilization protein LutB
MDNRVNSLIKNLQKGNITGLYCASKEEAVKKILEIIPSSVSIGLSGSQTLEQLGIVKRLEERGNPIFNQYLPGIKREDSLELRRKGTQADCYLASANAVSEKGELVFFSGYGNRTAGVSNAKNLIVVCGINKLSKDLDAALRRARVYATPLNCKRLNWQSACLEKGICAKEICFTPDYKRMCCQVLIIEAEVSPDRVKVILVGENLGF